MAKQNIFDNEVFYEGYKGIRNQKVNANNLFEIPALFSLLPKMEGKKYWILAVAMVNIAKCLLSPEQNGLPE